MSRIAVVGAAIVDGATCLVAHRSAEMSTPLKWEFPGGKVRDGEDPRAALRREIHEELGVEIAIGDKIGVGVTDRVELTVFVTQLVAGDPHPHEHDELRWVSGDEMAELDWAEADVPIWPHVARRMAGQ